ncbi:F-box domain-containing protein [Heracleum sosnowskyi]|uniref:F-box domain-containing protein n=1 Tax=Heracleum sosnowskyi TaxID=360622 RepID=A0AAD8NBQ4_9APIA|nr:F-box domain-containing protein [Heracleum sosnowskyi]
MAITSNSLLVPPLPPEIIEWEILTRLPVKSLLLYKSVCKSWNLLISSNHEFIKSQLVLNPNKDSLMLDVYYGHSNSFISKSEIIGCINGLVCFYRCKIDDSEVGEIAIWNPALNQCLVILTLPKKDIRHHNVLLGFGFDSVANDFKVMYGNLIRNQPLAIDVYSCKAACWKKIAPSNILYSGGIYNLREPAIVSGCPFWLIQKNEDAEFSLAVIWFDVRHEVFRLLPSFSCIGRLQSKDCVLMNFRDSFAIMVYDLWANFVKPIDVYTFNHRCSVWNKISIGPFTFKEPNIKLNGMISDGKHKVLEEATIKLGILVPCSRNGDILFVNPHGYKLYSINPETHTIKILKERDSVDENRFKCFNYSESLIFIEGMKPVHEYSRDKGRFRFLVRERLELGAS